MDGLSSLGDRIRSWVGLDGIDPERFPFLEKLERAEEDVALIRLVVVLVNGIAFLGIGVQGGPTSGSAIVVLALAFAYAVGTVLLQARPAFGEMSWSVFTVGLDALVISAWLAATGGWSSPYFPLWYASIAAVGYRFNLPITTSVSAAYAGAYAALCALTGGIGGAWIEFGVRIVYVPLTGAIVGLASEGYIEAEFAHRDAQRRLMGTIQRMDRRFAAVLADAPDRLAIVDPEGTVAYANGPLDPLGFATSEAGNERARGIHQGAIQATIRDRTPVEYLATPEEAGAEQRFWCRVAPIEDRSEAVGAVLTAREAPEGLSWEDGGSRDRTAHGRPGPRGWDLT